jgi:hypothetical protein
MKVSVTVDRGRGSGSGMENFVSTFPVVILLLSCCFFTSKRIDRGI